MPRLHRQDKESDRGRYTINTRRQEGKKSNRGASHPGTERISGACTGRRQPDRSVSYVP